MPSGLASPTETRHLLDLGGHAIQYTLRRSARRSLALTIDGRGLRAAAPLRMPQASVERFILQHGPWVLRKLAQWQLSASSPAWEAVPGAEFPVLGIPYRLEIQSGGRSGLTLAADGQASLRLQPGADARHGLRRELQALARADFTHRIARVAAEMKMPPPRLSLSSARTRWGSFNPRTGVRLNWRLIHCPPDLIDYVVAHELAHSREMNHSPRFWAVVAALHPDHLAARRRLRQLGPMLPVI